MRRSDVKIEDPMPETPAVWPARSGSLDRIGTPSIETVVLGLGIGQNGDGGWDDLAGARGGGGPPHDRSFARADADAGHLNSRESGRGYVPRCDIGRSHGASRSAPASVGEPPSGRFIVKRAMSRVRRGLRLHPIAVGSPERQTINKAPFSGNDTGISGYPGIAGVRNP